MKDAALAAGSGSAAATVDFSAPSWDGGSPITSYTATCTSSDGVSAGSASDSLPPASGHDGSVTVTGLRNDKNYNCSATATNQVGTSGPSNSVTASVVGTCDQGKTCDVNTSSGSSADSPAQTVGVTGEATNVGGGSVTLGSDTTGPPCPGSPPGGSSFTAAKDGFAPSDTLTVTVTVQAVVVGQAQVCFTSPVPFLSVSNPTVPQAGTALLLPCKAVANKPPCQLPDRRTKNGIVVAFVISGADPTFSVVVPTGRLVWPSNFPAGKVGTAYSSRLQSRGGKAPFHWKLASGALAPGLTLNGSSGAVSGKPTKKGTFTCIVQATDAESPPKVADISVSIKIT
ncbi:MAG TPA: putative Ig domain-containing protein [Acidimicrobiia bacterium]|nr:putative Ig domain-containing protein [Acidimicrobiia bacterium]